MHFPNDFWNGTCLGLYVTNNLTNTGKSFVCDGGIGSVAIEQKGSDTKKG